MAKIDTKDTRAIIEELAQVCINGLDSVDIEGLKEIVRDGEQGIAYTEAMIDEYNWQLELGRKVQEAAKAALKAKKKAKKQTLLPH